MATLYGFAITALAEALPFAHWGDDDDGPGWLFGLAFWLALIVVVILVLRGRGWFGPGGPRGGQGLSGHEIIERRFAEGRLSAEEFRERRAVLGEDEGAGGDEKAGD